MTTIRDVAKYADVSVATVSRVLNQKGYVSTEAKAKVLEAMKNLNYEPNAVARTLYHKTSNIIGLVVPDITNPFFPQLARAVEDVANQLGYTVILCNTDENAEKEKKYIHALKQKYVDGLILSASELDRTDYENLAVPCVALDRIIGDTIPSVVSDNKEGAKRATQHLIDKGCSFLIHLKGPEDVIPAEERAEGFKEVVNDRAVANVVANAEFNMNQAEKVMTDLLKKYPYADGVFASSDITAAGATKAVQRMGFTIPNEFQIIGFDGIPFGEMFSPSISTIAQPIYDMGRIATELLIKVIGGKKLLKKHVRLPVELIERETTK